MANNWSGTFDDLVNLQRGNTYKSSLLGQPGPVLLGLASIERNGGFKTGSLKTYGGETQQKHLLRSGDIYVSLKDVTQAGDLVGAVARVPKEIALGRLTQDTVKLDFKRKDIPKNFVYWLLRTPQFREYCKSRAIGTTNLSLRREDFLALPIKTPSEFEMALIDLFDALEEKIELNRQMNETLETMAQALFKAWFVDFEPVRANSENRPSQSASPEIAKLFPSEIENDIPKGWRFETIEFLTSLIIDHRGKTPKKLGSEWSEKGIPAISAKNIKSGRLVKKESIKFIDENLYRIWMREKLQVGDVLMTSEAPLGELLYFSKEKPLCLSQRVFALRANKKICLPSYLYFQLGSNQVQEEILGRATGTTVVGIRQSELRKVKVLLPPIEIQIKADQIFDASLKKIYANQDEIDSLKEIRDSLLPRLISGKIRVADIQTEIAAT